jgi:transcriptional regulator with XRE-family HTH domain
MTPPNGIPGAIRRAAKQQGITLNDLCAKSGLSNGTFYYLLHGTPPGTFETVRRLKAAGVRISRDVLEELTAP